MIAAVMILGCGYAGTAVARLARASGLRVIATVRSAARADLLRKEGFDVLVSPALTEDLLKPHLTPDTQVVVTYPPDGATDAGIAPHLASAGAIAYVSSTAVYGDLQGRIDDTSPVQKEQNPRGVRYLEAEETWRAAGATVLRCPAIYGPDRGLHVRVVRGEFRIAGDGASFTSRIHVEDLARLLLATAASEAKGETFVVGDRAPATQREICAWISQEYGVPLPPSVPIEQIHETLRANRLVDGSRALERLGVELAYPDYKTGMANLDSGSRRP